MLFDAIADNESVERDLVSRPPQVIGEFEYKGQSQFIFAACPLSGPSSDMSVSDSERQVYCLTDFGHGSLLPYLARSDYESSPLSLAQWAGQQPTVAVFGSIALRAPEVVIGSDFGPKVDIWAVGCLAFELLVGHWLFHPEDHGEEWNQEEDLLAQIFQITDERFSKTVLDSAMWRDRFIDDEGEWLLSFLLSATVSLTTTIARSPFAKEGSSSRLFGSPLDGI